MRNVTELREQLAALYGDIRSGDVDISKAQAMNNAAGKIIGTLKVQLDYAALRKELPTIQFLDE